MGQVLSALIMGAVISNVLYLIWKAKELAVVSTQVAMDIPQPGFTERDAKSMAGKCYSDQ